MSKIIVVGAGAAGMIAAGVAAGRGHDVIVVEKNQRPGRKLMITGKGRCNVTNNCDISDFMTNVPVGSKFLYSAITGFSPADTMEFFKKQGVELKVERGSRVFPVSDRAVEIVDALHNFVKKSGCKIITGKKVSAVIVENGQVKGVCTEDKGAVKGDAVIVCVGGKSYPLTGSTGDGYKIAEEAGHTVTPLKPSLVPIETAEQWVKELQGLTLKNVTVEVIDTKTKKTAYKELGEMLFTHFGITGPLILSASSHMREPIEGRYTICIDLKPALKVEQLDARLLRDFANNLNKNYANALSELLPASLIPVFVRLSDIPPDIKVNNITKEMRKTIIETLKCLKLTFKSFRPIEEAIITSGGVSLREIDPRTMESKLISRLFFAGEVLDIDAHTGGFNLQIAFSTGYAAGMSV